MKRPVPVRTVLAMALVSCLTLPAWAQDSVQQIPLGDIARKSRQEKQANDHAGVPKHVLDEENVAPRGMVTGTYICRPMPCSTMNVTLPPGSKYPGIIPLDGNLAHNISVTSGTLLQASDVQGAKYEFLVRSVTQVYRATIKFGLEEETTVDQWPALLTHFTMTGRIETHQGIALLVSVPNGTMGVACIYRDLVGGDGASVCESVLNSAKVMVPEKFRPQRDDPDPPENDDF